jgi:hypothetical protein
MRSNRNEDAPDLRDFINDGNGQAGQNDIRQKMDGLALGLGMVMLLCGIIAEREKEVRVRNGSPTVIMRMIKGRSRNVVAQKKNHQHPFAYFYQRLFHLLCNNSMQR